MVSLVGGHSSRYVPLSATTPRQRTLAGWCVECTCGWRDEGPFRTRRLAKILFTDHIKEVSPFCTACNAPKTPYEMSKSNPNLCKKCSGRKTKEWARQHPTEWERSRRKSWLKTKYGMSPEQYDALLAAQGGVCAICKNPPTDSRGFRMHIDHDHETGAVRGILCGSCNNGLGNFKDSPDLLVTASCYVTKHRQKKECAA
jgi:hypothetical protein